MTGTDPTDASAKSRFIVLQMMRLAGAALAVLGLVTIAGKVSLPVVAGYVLLAVGMFDLLAMPLILARRWKSPPQ